MKTSLNKAQRAKLITYLETLKNTLPNVTPLLQISERVKKRQAQKRRNYLHAIAIIEYLVSPTKEGINFKNTAQYNQDENIHVHRKSRQRKICKISQCQQST